MAQQVVSSDAAAAASPMANQLFATPPSKVAQMSPTEPKTLKVKCVLSLVETKIFVME